ncbi:MAG: indolepyruvate ferredoxin oxidoreductase [Bacteroidales bacterium]|jgi:indolepyruvate ferredoxin oxidoreductase alpha subunit|nr:indolepyruvate ferredoxin oxidoreductase [Bacteroidales bacterium]
MQKLLLGDEAIAQGALDAGISGVYAYPGTPSTEITEYIQHSAQAAEGNVHRQWSANEKTAMEAAVGMSYAGKRALVCMKHVGMNVAADSFMNVAITGANGGLVILAADDPSMHSSQNEQDSRYFGKFAFTPVFEPATQQEAYDMTRAAFDFSEKYGVPVLMRVTTRLAHSRSGVKTFEARKQNELHLPKNPKQFILLPAIARKQYAQLLEKQPAIINASENSPFNQYFDGEDKSLGIIASGIGFNYLMENYKDGKCPHPVLKISQYPLPISLIRKLTQECSRILVIEEGYPLIEEQLRGLLDNTLKINGRLDNVLPRMGELNPNLVAKALGMDAMMDVCIPDIVAARPPALCVGCPHIDSYNALNEAIAKYGQGRVFSDIGCYTLGALPPYNAIYTCVDMGASITMAKGAADAGLKPTVAVIGDSTFTHSGMTSLLDCVIEKTNITVMILDNSTTGMTGGQDSHAFGRLENICLGLGVEKEHIRILKPLKPQHAVNTQIIAQELEYNGVSVIIPTRECIQTMARRMKAPKQAQD